MVLTKFVKTQEEMFFVGAFFGAWVVAYLWFIFIRLPEKEREKRKIPMDDVLREMVLKAVYLLYKGNGIMRNPKRTISIALITQQIQCFTKKEIDSNKVKVAANELSLSGHLKEHNEKDGRLTYSIKDKGIIFIEGESKFLKEKNSETINIGNINISDIHAPIAIGKNITININQTYNELHQHLETLSKAIQDVDIDEAVKKDSLAEIITIRKRWERTVNPFSSITLSRLYIQRDF